MKGILIAVFLGAFGGYRFYKRQPALGFLYMFTLGLVGIGWAIDIIQAVYKYVRNKRHPEPVKLPDSLTIKGCEIAGAFADCKKDPSFKRFGVVATLPVGTVLSVETAYYEGKPYFLVCAPSGLDIGAFPAPLSAELKANYPDAIIEAILTNKSDVKYPKMDVYVSR